MLGYVGSLEGVTELAELHAGAPHFGCVLSLLSLRPLDRAHFSQVFCYSALSFIPFYLDHRSLSKQLDDWPYTNCLVSSIAVVRALLR